MFLLNHRVSKQEFKSQFIYWLSEQSLSSFYALNGFEILRAFEKQIFKTNFLSDPYEYKIFIAENRDLIEIIKQWIVGLELQCDDYEELFEIFVRKILIEEIYHTKESFYSIWQSFQHQIIKPNYVFQKSKIIKSNLENIFTKLFLQSKNLLKQQALEEKRALRQKALDEIKLLKLQMQQAILKNKNLLKQQILEEKQAIKQKSLFEIKFLKVQKQQTTLENKKLLIQQVLEEKK